MHLELTVWSSACAKETIRGTKSHLWGYLGLHRPRRPNRDFRRSCATHWSCPGVQRGRDQQTGGEKAPAPARIEPRRKPAQNRGKPARNRKLTRN